MLDKCLAKMYEVGTKVFSQPVKTKSHSLSLGFMFTLTDIERPSLRSETVTSGLGEPYISPWLLQNWVYRSYSMRCTEDQDWLQSVRLAILKKEKPNHRVRT
jgi:hypothetical protein